MKAVIDSWTFCLLFVQFARPIPVNDRYTTVVLTLESELSRCKLIIVGQMNCSCSNTCIRQSFCWRFEYMLSMLLTVVQAFVLTKKQCNLSTTSNASWSWRNPSGMRLSFNSIQNSKFQKAVITFIFNSNEKNFIPWLLLFVAEMWMLVLGRIHPSQQ